MTILNSFKSAKVAYKWAHSVLRQYETASAVSLSEHDLREIADAKRILTLLDRYTTNHVEGFEEYLRIEARVSGKFYIPRVIRRGSTLRRLRLRCE